MSDSETPPVPPPESREPGVYKYPPDSDTYRYFNGEEWDGPTLSQEQYEISAKASLKANDIPGVRRSLPVLMIVFGWFVVLLLIVLAYALFIRSSVDDGDDSETLTPPTTEAPSAQAVSPGQEAEGRATGESECEVRSFAGAAVNATTTLGSPGSVWYSSAEFDIQSDCFIRADIVWTGLAQDDEWKTTNNPGGTYCYMIEADAGPLLSEMKDSKMVTGPLTFTPDVGGGGTLSGWLAVYSGSKPGECPSPDEIGPYLLTPFGGEIEAKIHDGRLTATSLTFTGLHDTVTFSVEATEQAG
ncbi:MAG: hypothetical protein HKN95_11690 [Acidimicrobiia bacterium]|nr:hypothetical protein [Acidimicrobiia bacterium]